MAVAANGHRLAGVLSAASAAVWFDFFLTVPYQHFSISHRTDVETTVLLLIVGAAVTELAVRGRRQRMLAVTDEAYLGAIAATTELAASAPSIGALTDLVRTQLISLLGLQACRFERTRFGGLPRLEADGRLRSGDGHWDLDQYGMPSSPVELLAEADGRAYGRFVLDPVPGSVAPLPARRVAVILSNQVGALSASQSHLAR